MIGISAQFRNYYEDDTLVDLKKLAKINSSEKIKSHLRKQ